MLLGEAGGSRRAAVVLAALIALACALAVPAFAAAAELKVDSTGDETDANLLDPACVTAGGKCTLRAAIEQANESGEGEVVFDEAIFNGGIAGTIALGSGLPPITASFLRIEGECERGGVFGPCVGLEGPATGPALTVNHAFGVEIAGLAFGAAETGISVIEEAEQTWVTGSWFGLKLDGSSAPGVAGVSIVSGSAAAHIGGEAASAGNVFASLSGTALRLAGASRVKILGNYFGVRPDGASPAPIGEGIEIVSVPGFEAAGNSIGTALSKEAGASAPCDRGCNLISGATSFGVDLQGDGGEEGPSRNTTIAGNYFGLDRMGSGAVPNAAASIRVGEAPQVQIGGRKSTEANRINGGAVGVLAGPASPNLVVRGNAIGFGAGGSGRLAPPEEGLAIDSGELPYSSEAQVVDNRFAMAGGVAVAHQGAGALIAHNAISGADVGIRIYGASEVRGSLVEDNLIERSTLNGILLESNFNEALGNEVLSTGATGIKVAGPQPFGNTGNLVGGDDADSENRIFDSAGAAIEVEEPDERSNEIARNHGSGNGGLFIDLVAATPREPTYKVESPPVVLDATAFTVGGKGVPGSYVRVFRKAQAASGELASFLGEGLVGADGRWQIALAGVPGGSILAASQTGERWGTSELTTTQTPSGPSAGPSAASKPPADVRAPATTILKGPKGKTGKTTASFQFTADEAGSRFECKLDQKPFKACGSPRKYKHLKAGKHVFKVRAVDPAGNVGAPAKRKFTVVE